MKKNYIVQVKIFVEGQFYVSEDSIENAKFKADSIIHSLDSEDVVLYTESGKQIRLTIHDSGGSVEQVEEDEEIKKSAGLKTIVTARNKDTNKVKSLTLSLNQL